ncbi:MAG: YggS family pyridoxal phosphate-dependent enzyme [Planctomycetota bacterium]|jgi:pyridoxal phosphate enzyme (YggS family)
MVSRNELKDRYKDVLDRVAAAAVRSGRQPGDIITVAVTKAASPEQIRQLVEMGHQDLAENRVQQLQQRVAMIDEFLSRHRIMSSARTSKVPDEVRWHMIGHLQRNKVKAVLPVVKLIHSLDSLRLVEEVHDQAIKQDREIDVLLQVNVSGEKSKGGITPPAVPHMADQIDSMMHLNLRGLMTIAPKQENPEDNRIHYQRLAEMFKEMHKTGRYGQRFQILSMGMSDDYELAIEEGANVVRVGRAFFGEPEVTVNPDVANTTGTKKQRA